MRTVGERNGAPTGLQDFQLQMLVLTHEGYQNQCHQQLADKSQPALLRAAAPFETPLVQTARVQVVGSVCISKGVLQEGILPLGPGGR